MNTEATGDAQKNLANDAMSQFVMSRALMGAAAGATITGFGSMYLYKNRPWFRNNTNVSARSFLFIAGPAVGFSLAADWAAVHYYRYIDRPQLTGFSKLDEEQALVKQAHASTMDIVSSWADAHRFHLIGLAWASTLGTVLYKDYRNPNLPGVHKFGHARIAAQFVTLAAIILAFAFNPETGPSAKKWNKID